MTAPRVNNTTYDAILRSAARTIDPNTCMQNERHCLAKRRILLNPEKQGVRSQNAIMRLRIGERTYLLVSNHSDKAGLDESLRNATINANMF